MIHDNHQLARDLLVAIARGELPDALTTADMTAWTLTGGDCDKTKFAGGVKILAAIFNGTLAYREDRIVAEGDQVISEVQSTGKLLNGQDFHNHHIFIFRIRDGKVDHVREYMNPIVVSEKILPAMKDYLVNAGH